MNDDTARYRSRDRYDHELEPTGPSTDPLAELARLIGRNDPFADLARDRDADRSHDHYAEPARDDWHADDRHSDWPAEPAPTADYDAPAHDEPAYDEPAPSHALAPEPHYDHRDYAAAPQQHDDRYEDDRYLHSGPRPSPADYGAPDDPAAPPPHHETDDEKSPRRLGVFVTVAAVLGLAAVGIGGALAYRTYFGTLTKSSPPPIIRASSEPTKVVPPAPPKNDTAKLSYDRFGDRSQNEQVVVREEKPINPNNLVVASPPSPTGSAIFPPVTPPGAAPVAPQSSANPPSVLTEPKRVHTVTVRPDQPDPGTQPQMVAPVPVPPPVPPAPSQTAATTPPPAPAASPPPVAKPKAVTRTVAPARAARVHAAPAHNPNAPLSLAPDATATAMPAPPSRSVRAAAPMRIASTPTAPTSRTGHYLVQVSSQRSQADAQRSFRSIRTKYSSVLGSREPVIRRADLGAKGVYYRAMVGPFPTRDQAIQLCASLKAAGGACVVQTN